MYRDAPEMREPRVTLRVRLPRSLATYLDLEAEKVASVLLTKTAARDELIERALSARLPSTPRCNGLQHTHGRDRGC